MRNLLIIMLFISVLGSVIAYSDKDMKYHNEPRYFASVATPSAYACYFKLIDFGISGYNYKINIIGFIGYVNDGPVNIYVTSKEKDNVPVCDPPNYWQDVDYGPKSWHINNSYPNYDDCNLYDDNWHYSKDVDKFWCIYYAEHTCPPYPIFDEIDNTRIINSLTWAGGVWYKGVYNYTYSNWCMHCVIVYWGSDIENTSLGVVKALFK